MVFYSGDETISNLRSVSAAKARQAQIDVQVQSNQRVIDARLPDSSANL